MITAAIITPPPHVASDITVTQMAADLRGERGVIKLHFSKITLSFVRKPKVRGCLHRVSDGTHLPVASLRDAIGAKLFAVMNREALNDYIDIAAVLERGWSREQVIAAARAVAPLHEDRLDLERALARLANPPEAIADELTPVQYNLLRT